MRLYVAVLVEINNILIDEIAGVPVSGEGTEAWPMVDIKKAVGSIDKYRGIGPEGEAQIEVGLEEKVSGPAGTYSSVTVITKITLRCDQKQETVKRAMDLAYSDCAAAIERYIDPAQKLLASHLDRRG